MNDALTEESSIGWRKCLERPEYIPASFVMRISIPLMIVFGLGLLSNLIKMNLVVVFGLAVELILIAVTVFYFKLERYYGLFVVASVFSPAFLVFFAAPLWPFIAACWSFVAISFLFVTLHYSNARTFSVIFIVGWITSFYGAIDVVDVFRFVLTVSIVAWALYNFMRIISDQYAEVTRLAFIDPLTGVFNRRILNEKMQGWIDYLRRYQQEKVILAVIDLDYFKILNDRYGHEQGDRALCFFANTLKNRLRTTDVLARYGGEEFVVIFPKTDADQADKILQEIREELQRQPLVNGGVLRFTAGLAELEVDDSIDSWLHRADKAMYQAKDSGRGCNRLAEAS
jgi:diguanylate cyclase (GGDEF)-like protein